MERRNHVLTGCGVRQDGAAGWRTGDEGHLVAGQSACQSGAAKRRREKRDRALRGCYVRRDNAAKGHKEKNNPLVTTACVVLCVVLAPLLVINVASLVRGVTTTHAIATVTGVLPLSVLTDSMYPEISAGDLVFCTVTQPEDVQVGDVISFYDPASESSIIVTHRVVSIEQTDAGLAWRTKGDANNVEDRDLVPASSLLARYTGVYIPGGGAIVDFLKTPGGMATAVAVPVAVAALVEVARLQRKDGRGKTVVSAA